MPQALRVADITLEEIPAEIFRRVVGNIQVRPHLRIAGAVEAVTGQAVFLEQRKALVELSMLSAASTRTNVPITSL